MVAAQTKGHEEGKSARMQEKQHERKKRKTNSRKQGTKARKQENRTYDVSIATNLPVSATKPRRGPCHTICNLLPALVGNGKRHCCRCRPPPPEQINKNQTKLPGFGGCIDSNNANPPYPWSIVLLNLPYQRICDDTLLMRMWHNLSALEAPLSHTEY